MSAAVLDDYLDDLLVGDPAPAVAPPAAVPPAPAAAATPAVPALAAVPAGPAAAPEAPAPAAAPAPAPAAAAPAPLVAPPAPLAATPAPVARHAPAAPMPFQPAPSVRAPYVPAPRPAATDPAEPPGSHRRAADRSSRWLRLRCGSQAYGLELLKVQEVVLPTPLLALRGTPPAMLGVMNLRGQVVPVMDLGVYLGQSAQPVTAQTRIVVLEEKGETLGLRVSAVEDVANLTDQQIEPPDNARVGRIHNALFRGIARQGADPMILLDASCLLQPAGDARDAA